jgi:streptogramin lyase
MIFAVDQRRAVVIALGSLDDGAAFMRLGLGPGSAGPMRKPGGIAVTADRRLVIADSGNDRVLILDPTNGSSVVLDSSASAVGPFRRPTGVAVNAAGLLAVADTDNHRVVTVHMDDGSGWSAFGAPGGMLPGGFEAPTAVHLDAAGRILVADPGTARLVRVDAPDGSGWTEIALPPASKPPRPYALATGPNGGILVSDLVNSRMLLLAADDSIAVLIDGLPDRSLVAPVGASMSGGDLVIADAATCCITRWTLNSATGAWSLAQRLDGRGGHDDSREFSSLSGLAI